MVIVSHNVPRDVPNGSVYSQAADILRAPGLEAGPLEQLEVIETKDVTHLRFRVIK